MLDAFLASGSLQDVSISGCAVFKVLRLSRFFQVPFPFRGQIPENDTVEEELTANPAFFLEGLYFLSPSNPFAFQPGSLNPVCVSPAWGDAFGIVPARRRDPRSVLRIGTKIDLESNSDFRLRPLPRKEVIQPHLPIRLPCYDFTPVIGLTFDGCSLSVGSPASGAPNSHGVTGGVYKARERIHRGMLIRDY